MAMFDNHMMREKIKSYNAPDPINKHPDEETSMGLNIQEQNEEPLHMGDFITSDLSVLFKNYSDSKLWFCTLE